MEKELWEQVYAAEAQMEDEYADYEERLFLMERVSVITSYMRRRGGNVDGGEN